jgi:hypothetical protein
MSLPLQSFDAIPAETARVARAAFPHSTHFMPHPVKRLLLEHVFSSCIAVPGGESRGEYVPGSRPHRPATRPSAGGGEPAGPLPQLHVLLVIMETPETVHRVRGLLCARQVRRRWGASGPERPDAGGSSRAHQFLPLSPECAHLPLVGVAAGLAAMLAVHAPGDVGPRHAAGGA